MIPRGRHGCLEVRRVNPMKRQPTANRGYGGALFPEKRGFGECREVRIRTRAETTP